MMKMTVVILFLSAALLCGPVHADDWPMYRKDAARGGYTAESLRTELKLNWVYKAPHRPGPAWPRSDRMLFDRVSRVVIAEGTVFFGGTVDGKVLALDLQTAESKWEFFTEGPVRLAPAVWKQTVFVTSDDGCLYALSTKDGSLLWKHRGGADGAMVLGNGHMISKWPARGGAAVLDGVVYYGSGIWPTEGFSLYAIDASTGKEIWSNKDSGSRSVVQPHTAKANSGPAAQGHLAIGEDRVLVPTGRAVPAGFDRKTGKFKFFLLNQFGSIGGDQVMAVDDAFVTTGAVCQTADGLPFRGTDKSRWQSYNKGRIFANFYFRHPKGVVGNSSPWWKRPDNNCIGQFAFRQGITTSPKGKSYPVRYVENTWLTSNPFAESTCMIGAGNSILSGSPNHVGMIDMDSRKATWSHKVEGTVYDLAVADGKLLVSTDQGLLYCFGPGDKLADPHAKRPSVAAPDIRASKAAKAVVAASGIRKGYCLDLGCGDGALAMELARQTDLHVIAVDDNAENVARLRKKLDAANLLGTRVTVLHRDLKKTHLPDYFANLVVSSRSLLKGGPLPSPSEATRVQKPCDGVLCTGLADAIKTVVRSPLKGAGAWNHQYGDAGNSSSSGDTLVNGNLTVLWFNDVLFEVVDRHHRGPSPIVDRGRIIHPGIEGLIAVDAYNGHEMWRYPLPGWLKHNSAKLSGGVMCLDGDDLYVRTDDRCLRIAAASGKLLRTYRLDDPKERWGYLSCSNGILIGSTSNQDHVVARNGKPEFEFLQKVFFESKSLFAIDVETGKQLWKYRAKTSIRHHAIAAGPKNVYLIDRPLAWMDGNMRKDAFWKYWKSGKFPKEAEHKTGTLVALDRKTGAVRWKNEENIYGTVLAYSAKHKALLMSYQPMQYSLPSDMIMRGKPTGMAGFKGQDGKRLWDRKVEYRIRPVIMGRTVQTVQGAWDLLTGAALRGPLTKSHGCGPMTSSEHMLLFRSGTLGYYNVKGSGKTQFFGGMRPGCWVNVVPAGGIVVAPDSAWGCKCSYLNLSWIALQPVVMNRNQEQQDR